MDGEAARVADIGDVVEQLQRVDEFAARVRAARQFEAEQPAIAALEIFVGAGAGLAGLDRGVDDRDDLGALRQPGGDRGRVLAMALDAQRQGFEALQDEEGVEGRERRAEIAQQGGARS